MVHIKEHAYECPDFRHPECLRICALTGDLVDAEVQGSIKGYVDIIQDYSLLN